MNMKEKGFSLIETMVAIVIVAVGILAMASMLITGIKTNHVSEQRMNMAALAQSAMENLEQRLVATNTAAIAEGFVTAQLGAGVTPAVTLSPDPLVQGPAGVVLKLDWVNRGVTKSVVLRNRIVIP